MPPLGFKFPVIQQGNKNRSFQSSWLTKYEWLAYSIVCSDALCKVCIIFGQHGTNDVKLGKLVTEPLKTYKKAIEVINRHDNLKGTVT